MPRMRLPALVAAVGAGWAIRAAGEAPGREMPPELWHELVHFQRSDPKHFGAVARSLRLSDDSAAGRTSLCSSQVIGNVGVIAGQSACANYVWNSSASAVLPGGNKGSAWQAAGNIDPIYGSLFPADNTIPAPTASQLVPPIVFTANYSVPPMYVQQQGLRVAPQVGWGGGPNVPLGPPTTATVWGVHATAYTAAQPASSTLSVLISWLMGGPLANVSVGGVGGGEQTGGYSLVCPAGSGGCALGTLMDTPAAGAFLPANLSFQATISMGTAASQLSTVSTSSPTCLQYLRVARDLNYLSPYVCHAVLSNLQPATTYFYNLTATVTGVPAAGPSAGTYAMPAATYSSAARVYKLTTVPVPSTGCPAAGSCASSYPVRMGLIADVGQTYNSSLTAQFLATYLSASNAHMVLNVGDFTYGDEHGMYSTFPDGDDGTNPWFWDSWSAMWQSALGQALWFNTAGNHEIESLKGQAYNNAKYTDGPTSYNFFAADKRYPYQSYSARFPHGAQSSASYGDMWLQQYYSQNLGPVHLISLNSYIPFVVGTDQYTWFLSDIQAVSRTAQPWLIVQYHVPIYHSYLTHFKEAECFRGVYEPLFYQYQVDFVLNGHVHAYERTHPTYNYTVDPCGPVYITIGDGGNFEGPYRNFMDEKLPGSTVSYCEVAAGRVMRAGVSLNNTWSPSYQLSAQPPSCVTLSFQPAEPGTVGLVPNPYDGTNSTFWCQSKQPAWSAYRDPSFGFASLTLLSDTSATWSWYRNVDQDSVSTTASTLRAADQATYTRYTGACGPLAATNSTNASVNGSGPSNVTNNGSAALQNSTNVSNNGSADTGTTTIVSVSVSGSPRHTESWRAVASTIAVAALVGVACSSAQVP